MGFEPRLHDQRANDVSTEPFISMESQSYSPSHTPQVSPFDFCFSAMLSLLQQHTFLYIIFMNGEHIYCASVIYILGGRRGRGDAYDDGMGTCF